MRRKPTHIESIHQAETQTHKQRSNRPALDENNNIFIHMRKDIYI